MDQFVKIVSGENQLTIAFKQNFKKQGGIVGTFQFPYKKKYFRKKLKFFMIKKKFYQAKFSFKFMYLKIDDIPAETGHTH